MKRYLLILTILLSFSTISITAAQDEVECPPDLTAVTDLLDEAQTALDDGDSDTAFDLMAQADDLLTAYLDNCAPPPVLVDPADAEDYALTLDDLPDGWLEAAFESNPEDRSFLCSELPDSDSVRVRQQFLASDVGPAMIYGLTVFNSVEEAEDGFAAVLAIANECDAWITTTDSGDKINYATSILSEDDYGAQSVTLRITYNTVVGTLTYIQHNNTVISIGIVAAEGTDLVNPDLVENIIELTIERLG